MKRLSTLILIAFAMLLGACSQIDTGNVGVERTLGKVSTEALPPGVYFTLFKTVDEFTGKEVLFQLDDMRPKSKDNLTMQDMDIDVIYKVDGAKVPALYAKYQGDVVQHKQVVKDGSSDLIVSHGRVVLEAREAVYNSVSSFDATTMHTKRTELSELIRKTIQSELDKADKGAFIVAGVYQQSPPDVTGRDVFLVDFSYKRAVVEQMLKAANSVCVIDHHKTAVEDLQPLFIQDSWTGEPKQLAHFTDLDRSGATLAWDYLFPGEDRPLLLGHVEDRDLWRFKLAGTREIQAFVFSHEYTFEQWDRLMNADQVELLKMTAAGAAIERKHHKDVAELVKVCQRRMVIGNYSVPVASLPYTLVSDAAHLMAQGQPFAACYWDTEEGRVFGLRAADDGVDVSEIAKEYGGGGHAKAAGFKVPRGHSLAMA